MSAGVCPHAPNSSSSGPSVRILKYSFTLGAPGRRFVGAHSCVISLCRLGDVGLQAPLYEEELIEVDS